VLGKTLMLFGDARAMALAPAIAPFAKRSGTLF
jgi:hypothetical protein